jgi:cytochrome c-type biogenesis protein CcmH
MTFWTISVALFLLAIGFLAWPMLRLDPTARGRTKALTELDRAFQAQQIDAQQFAQERQSLLSQTGSTPSKLLFIGFAALLCAAALGLYAVVGQPALIHAGSVNAAQSASQSEGAQLDEAIKGLVKRLQEEPNNVEGWLLLGRGYKATERFELSRDAYRKAYALAPDQIDIQVEYAEIIALASTTRMFSEESRRLLASALKVEPTHQRALWLMGISEAQIDQYEKAVSYWETLLKNLPEGSEIADSVRAQMAEAQARITQKTTDSNLKTNDSASSVKLVVQIDITPELKSQLSENDVLYVFARLPEGARMPLAIQKLTNPSFPVEVVLDDQTSMMPSMKLSTATQVVVGARVSKTGSAMPSSGDFQIISGIYQLQKKSLVVPLLINEVVP